LRIEVFKASEEDAYNIAEISFEVAKEGIVREFKRKEVEELLSNENYYVVVGKIDKEVVGYVLSTYSGGKLHVLDIAVKKSKRRIGISKMLVRHLISHASEKGLPEVYCEVKARNIPALNLFTSLGFRFKLFSTLVEGGFYGLYLPIQPHQSATA